MIPFRWKEIKKEQWILLLLVGILIMVAVLPAEKSRTVQEDTPSQTETAEKEESSHQELRQYEEKLEKLLSRMDGAGQVQVMITEAVSQERVVEKDTPYTIQLSQNGDGADASEKSQQENREETTVFERDANGKETPYVKKTLAPQIEGVLVLAQGGDNAVVARNITEAVMALFGIEAHKIKVMKSM